MSNTEIILKMYEAFVKRDALAIMERIDEKIIITQTEQLPWGGEFHGPEGLQTFFGKLLSTVNSNVEAQEFIEADNRVAVIGRTHGTVIANGNPFDIKIVHVWTLENGKATRFEPYVDTPGMLRALNAETRTQ